MTLSPGTRLGPYELGAPIGAGGMGEVYRAKDTRLERTVAVKVLSAHLSSSPESRQRFEREAKAISQLSHPHICALYDVGNQDGVEFLVMEYLEGETLAERLLKGPLPFSQVLRYGVEIADALDKAHRQGIVHRDLKPGNVMITKSGVKLLDFGLAKALAPTSSESQLAALPTQAAPVTREGTILGTLQYMAPEQLEGREADARSDVFAFGAVLYEMATGKRAFPGATQASVIGSILRDEPRPMSEIQPTTPSAFDRMVRTCLAKDPDDRWQTTRDVALQLGWVERDRTAEAPASLPIRRARFAAVIPWVVAAIGLGLAVLAVTTFARKTSRREVVRAFLPPPENSFFHSLDASSGPVAVSPDGRRLAFSVIDPEGNTLLWYRDLDAPTAIPIPGTDEATFPFWSPDSRSLGFFSRGRLKVVEASGSAPAPRALAEAASGRGGSWSIDGTILFGPSARHHLMRIPAAGGKPVAVTRLEEGEVEHSWPWFLPDGRRFLYRARFFEAERNALFLASLDSKERRLVLQIDSDVAYSPSGHILFRRGDRLMSARFNAGEGRIEGEPVELAQSVEHNPFTGKTVFSVSENLLAYAHRSELRLSRLAWFDRTGRELGELGPPAMYVGPTLSPDGRKVAVSLIERLTIPPDVWIYDTALRTGTRLTRGRLVELMPVFSPDGRRVAFASIRKGPWDLHEISTAAGGEEKTLLESENSKWPTDFSPDGRFLLFREFDRETLGDLKLLPLSGEPRPRDFMATRYKEESGDFSPDGRWVAYASDESGRMEIYVSSFAEAGRRYRVSSGGGGYPRWSHDGRELFYLVGGKTMTAVSVRLEGPDLAFGSPLPLFDVRVQMLVDSHFRPSKYDVSADGRFLIAVRASDEPPPPLVLVLNWAEALKPRP
ncbi:MAG TPA: protein kinase [Thermoanaerobaculia bacterium]|nr:protein kinase [Thermoanaerobaculia bacterium]HEV8608597.1 protein kinase [Thermoanaerobaculia bacterium]